MHIPFLALLLLCPQDPIAEEARKDLHAWYANRELESPDVKPMRLLASRDAKERAWAGAYLLALFMRTVYDEEHGLTPERKGFKMGGGPQDDASRLRWNVADSLGDATFFEDGRDALPVARYLLKEDPYGPNQIPAMKAISKIRTAEADALLREAVLQPHPAFQVLRQAMEESARRKLPGLDESFRKLANHYHSGIRGAARDAVKALGLGEIPESKPGDRVTPGLEAGLRRLAGLPMETVPADAPWKLFTETHSSWVNESQGWLLKADDKEFQVLQMDGTLNVLAKDKTVVRDGSLNELARRVIELRAKLDADKDEKAREELDKLLGQGEFMRHGGEKQPTLAEGMMAAWLWARGDRDMAADLVVPLLEKYEHETAMVDGFRDLIAIKLDGRMLASFCAGKYERALTLARHLSGPNFKDWYRQDRARDLAEQIPRRLGVDFVKLTLVTPDEWEVQAKKLTRAERIRHLVERLRLIQAVQDSIPGGVDFEARQSRHVPGANGEKDQWIPLINPFVELYRMNLSAKECLLLRPVLESGDYFLAYNLQRFLPNNPIDLYRARWLAETLINAVARKKVVDRTILDGDDAAKTKTHLDDFEKWCETQGGVRLGDRLEREIASGDDWEAVSAAIADLFELDVAALGRAIEARVPRDPKNRNLLFQVAGFAGPTPAVLEAARLDKASGWAAYLVVRHGDKSKREGIAALCESLNKVSEEGLQEAAVEVILDRGDAVAEEKLVALLSPDSHVKVSTAVIQRLFEKGRPEARDFLLDLLDGKRHESVKFRWVLDGMDGLLFDLDCWGRVEYPPSLKGQAREASAKARAEFRKAWVRSTFEQIKKGEKPALVKPDLDPPFKKWGRGAQWVRQL